MGPGPSCARREGAALRGLKARSGFSPFPPNTQAKAGAGFFLLPSAVSFPPERFCSKPFKLRRVPEPEERGLKHLCWHAPCRHMSARLRRAGLLGQAGLFSEIKGFCTAFFSFSRAAFGALAAYLVRTDRLSPPPQLIEPQGTLGAGRMRGKILGQMIVIINNYQ